MVKTMVPVDFPLNQSIDPTFQGEDSGETDVLLGERRLRLERRWPRRVDRQPRGSGAHPDAGDDPGTVDRLDRLDRLLGAKNSQKWRLKGDVTITNMEVKHGETW